MHQNPQGRPNSGPRPPVYKPRPRILTNPAAAGALGGTAGQPNSASASSSGSSLSALVPSTTTGVLLCLAALLSAGFLVRTLHPRYKYRIAPRSGKNRATVIQKIIAKQATTKAEVAADRKSGNASPARSRSNSRARALSASVAATSAAIVSGLSKLTAVTSNAIASTSSAKLDSDSTAAGSSARTGNSGREVKTAAAAAREDAFSTGVGKLLAVDATGKKNRGKKGKGAGLAPSHGSSLAVSPLGSPARRPSLQDVHVDLEPPPVFEVSTQTTFALADERTTTSASTPTPTASHGPFTLPSSDASVSNEPPSARPRSPATPPTPLPPPSFDATVQTSPRLGALIALPIATAPPSLPKPFDLHASFQSTPPVRPPSPSPSAYSHPSPPLSPSPSRRLSALPHGSPRIQPRPTPFPTDYLSSAEPSSGNNSGSPSPVATRSRKQARKASAAAASNSSQPTVVGMPRAPRSRDPTDESHEMNGESSAQRKPALLRVDTSSSRLSSSPEHSNNGVAASEKGKEREQAHSRRGSGSMSSGKGRSGVPPPIGIPSSPAPPTRQPLEQRRLSSSTSGNSGGSASTSPYLSHQILMTMTPPDAGRRKSVTAGSGLAKGSPIVGEEEDERFWREAEEEDQDGKWDAAVGLAIELDDGDRRRLNDGGSAGSRSRRGGSRDGRETNRSWSSTGGSSSPNLQSLCDSYFPTASVTALTSPESSPHPPNRQLLPLSTSTTDRPWSPQLMAQQYRMIPHPSANSASTTPQIPIPPPPPPPIPFSTHPLPSQGNGRTSRQSNGLSVPSGSSQQQQQALQQQQAFAFYAAASAQYQHVIALQLQAQQHQQRQQQQVGQQQHHQQRQRHDPEHSLSNSGMGKAPPTPTGLVYPISGTSIPPPPPPPQTPQSMMHSSGWGSVPPSPSLPPGSHFGMSSISPTSATFPSSATSSSYSHQHQLPSVQSAMNPYYLGSPAAAYLSNFSMSPQMPPPLGGRQSSSGQGGGGRGKGGRNGGRNGGGDGEKMKSPRPGADRARSASAATLTTLSSMSNGGQVVSDATGWKIKVRTAEMEADRSAKELEIARWRLSVLEEEQRAIERENQEALRALATRAMRAEARIKLLEDARVPDSSSASGSGSPATRPSSVAGSNELPSDPLPPPVSSLEDADSSARNSPPGVTTHYLAWAELDQVSFTTRPAAARPALSPSMRRKSARASGEWKASRKGSGRRRSSHGFPSPAIPFEEASDEDIEILLDSPVRRKSLPRAATSRRSSFLGDEFFHDGSSVLDDDELSYLDDDEARSLRGSESDPSCIGSLPGFIRPSSSSTSRPPSINEAASPRLEPLTEPDDCLEDSTEEAEEADDHEQDSSVLERDAPQVLVTSTEDGGDTHSPTPAGPAHSTSSSSEDYTPKLASLPSPPADDEETEEKMAGESAVTEEARERRSVDGETDTES